jgi:hypothetical protein
MKNRHLALRLPAGAFLAPQMSFPWSSRRNTMNMQDIRTLARELGVARLGRITKLQLIRTIQTQEGNFPCFATALNAECNQQGCLWRQDCFDNARKISTAEGTSA